MVWRIFTVSGGGGIVNNNEEAAAAQRFWRDQRNKIMHRFSLPFDVIAFGEIISKFTQ